MFETSDYNVIGDIISHKQMLEYFTKIISKNYNITNEIIINHSEKSI